MFFLDFFFFFILTNKNQIIYLVIIIALVEDEILQNVDFETDQESLKMSEIYLNIYIFINNISQYVLLKDFLIVLNLL